MAGLIAYGFGARRDALFWSILLGAFPLQFVMAFLTMRLFPAEAEITGDYRSVLHPVDPTALERAARDDERRAMGADNGAQGLAASGQDIETVHTQSEAKRFFVEKVIHRARTERVFLSDAERRMLSWSESDPEFIADPQLVEQLASEMSDEEYEKKIAGLLERQFAEDVAVDPATKGAWRHALSVLDQGDHHIAIMIDRAVGDRFKRWWQL